MNKTDPSRLVNETRDLGEAKRDLKESSLAKIGKNSIFIEGYGYCFLKNNFYNARRAGSDGSMSASGSAGPGFDPRRGGKFSFENFQPRG